MLTVSDERRGQALLVLSALAFSVMSVQVKLAGRELPVAMLVLARGIVTLVLSVAWVSARRIHPWGHDRWGLVQRALDGRLLVAIALALTGTVIVARPSFVFGAGTPLDATGIAVALGSALLSACAYATVRRLARTEHPDVIVLYFAMFAAPLALPFALVAWVWPSPRGWLLMLGLGIATQLGQTFMTRGLALMPAARGTTIGYVQIVFAASWGVFLFDEALSGWTLTGAGLVIVAVLLLLAGRAKPAVA